MQFNQLTGDRQSQSETTVLSGPRRRLRKSFEDVRQKVRSDPNASLRRNRRCAACRKVTFHRTEWLLWLHPTTATSSAGRAEMKCWERPRRHEDEAGLARRGKQGSEQIRNNNAQTAGKTGRHQGPEDEARHSKFSLSQEGQS